MPQIGAAMSDKILIIGLGSIGQRHARNALALGCEVIGYDPVPKPEIILNAGQRLTQCESLNVALAHKPLAVIVATPPKTHWQIGYQVNKAGLPCLIEKPLASDLSGAEGLCHAFEQKNIPLAVGYQFRHTAALRRLKVQADAGEFGTIYAAHAEFASQKWCSDTYPAELLLETSHEQDLIRLFLGDPKGVVSVKSGTGSVIGAQILFKESMAHIYLDGIAPGYRRRLTLYGSKGVGEWSLDQTENDQAYVDELAEFLRVCRGEQAEPLCTGRDGWWAVRMVEAIRRSGESGRWEAV